MNHNTIWLAIEQFAADNNISCSRLARISGMDPTTFNKSKRWSREGQPRYPSTHSIAKILSATNSNISDFAKYIQKNEAK